MLLLWTYSSKTKMNPFVHAFYSHCSTSLPYFEFTMQYIKMTEMLKVIIKWNCRQRFCGSAMWRLKHGPVT